MTRPLSKAQVAMLRRMAAHPWGADTPPCGNQTRGHLVAIWWRTARSLVNLGYVQCSGRMAVVTPKGRDAAAKSNL